jgi:hypothetical protein
MHFEKIIFRGGGPSVIIRVLSPVFYLLSRLVMRGKVIAVES